MPTGEPQDTREFYQKKRFILLGVLIILSIIIKIGEHKKESTTTEKYVAQPDNTIRVETQTELKNEIEGLNEDLDFDDDHEYDDYNEPAAFLIFTDLYDFYRKTLEKGKKSTDDSIKILTKTLERKLIRLQKRNYPQARLAYQKMLKRKLWENDIYVSISGSANTTLNFVVGVFAANKNKKDMQESITKILSSLRFKKTTYRWYKGAEEFTYYTIKSENDSDVKIVENGN